MTTTIEYSLCPALVETLKADRDSFNARFAERQFAANRINGDEFLSHLSRVIDPIVRAVAEQFPERVRATVHELHDVSLSLYSEMLLGPRARQRYINEVWECLLPAVARHVARAPTRMAGCLSNAAYNIASQADTRPDWWIGRMIDVAPHCESVDMLLDAGKVLAWQAGMAQYRATALETARRLPVAFTGHILNLSPASPPDLVTARLDRLEAEPWFHGEASSSEFDDEKTAKLVREIGAFRGFGGAFIRPPTVSYAEGCFWASDGESIFQFAADACGWHIQSRGSGALPSNQKNGDVVIKADGTVRWAGRKVHFAQLASSNSFASDGITAAVTVPTSHHIFLLAEQ